MFFTNKNNDSDYEFTPFGLHRICDSCYLQLSKALKDQLFNNRTWRPESNKTDKKTSNSVRLLVFDTRSAVHKAALLHHTMSES